MRVFVAGATGAVGRPLVRLLVERGHQVIASTRTRSKFPQLERLGAQPVVVDGLDASAVGEAVGMAEPEVIIHQMTALAGAGDMKHFDRTFAVTNQLRTTGTDNLLAAARATGVRRVVAQSFTGWPNERSGGPVKTEHDPLDPTPPREQRETLAGIRYLERAMLDAPVDGVVLRYGLLYGPGASEEMVDLLRRRRMPIVGGGDGIWSMLHVDDAAASAVSALEHGRGIYNIVDDDPAPVREILTAMAVAASAKPPMRLPVWLARPLAGEVGISMLTRVRGSSNAKARRELDWAPRWSSWREGFRKALTDRAAVAG